jgi:hypothetical protein
LWRKHKAREETQHQELVARNAKDKDPFIFFWATRGQRLAAFAGGNYQQRTRRIEAMNELKSRPHRRLLRFSLGAFHIRNISYGDNSTHSIAALL